MGATILVVDNDPRALSGLVDLLRDEGYSVRSAASFEEARRLLAAEPPALLVTDVRLGPYNGLQLVARARFDAPDTAAIVVTGFPDIVLAEEARRLGAMYLTKPFHPAEFLALVETAVTAAVRRPFKPSGD